MYLESKDRLCDMDAQLCGVILKLCHLIQTECPATETLLAGSVMMKPRTVLMVWLPLTGACTVDLGPGVLDRLAGGTESLSFHQEVDVPCPLRNISSHTLDVMKEE